MNWYERLQVEHAVWVVKRYPNQPPMLPLAGLIGEAGEVFHSLYRRYKQEVFGTNPRHTNLELELLDGIGDCIIYICSWCNTVGESMSRYNWDDIASNSTQLDINLGYTLVNQACLGYKNGKVLQVLIDTLTIIGKRHNIVLQDAAMTTWQHVKWRVL